jgi:hypothetical protein
MQTTSHILMIRPVRFGYNAETAVNNAFQLQTTQEGVQEKALEEFDNFINKLRAAGVDVTVMDDTTDPHTPDSIFPNNWVSFHEDGTVFLYPMFAINRRLERKPGVLQSLSERFDVKKINDLSTFEADDKFLEGTGSMVLDRDNKIAYACLSPRTDTTVLQTYAAASGYAVVSFGATDSNGVDIYHTNVMMCVADAYVVICMDAIPDAIENATVKTAIQKTGKQLIEISLDQMNRFAGNMLQVHNNKGEKILVMSTQAYRSLSAEQINQLETYNPIVHASLDTIEQNGGGSARCMMAEVHLPLL